MKDTNKWAEVEFRFLIDEMVFCDMEKYIDDIFILNNYVVFDFKKTVKKDLIKYISIVFKNRIIIFKRGIIYQIVFCI